MNDNVMELYDKMKELSVDEICWLVRNITYDLVSYWSEDNKGRIYDGSYDKLQIEQATRMQQAIRNRVDIFNQILNHRNFENDYFEDLLTGGYYSKFKEVQDIANEYKEKAEMYDSLCD